MEMKLFGALLVILACGGFGIFLAQSHRAEIRGLRMLSGMLEYMECELQYRMTPLPQLCRKAASAFSNGISQVFAIFADELDGQIFPDTDRCMQSSIAKHGKIPAYTCEGLTLLGKTFGAFDLKGQLNEISAIRQMCCERLTELEENKDARLRSYRTLGFCTGAALAIILI